MNDSFANTEAIIKQISVQPIDMSTSTKELSKKKQIILKSSDGETFEVDEVVAMESQVIKHMIEDNCTENGIPLPKVTGNVLAKVIEYCKKHVASKGDGDEEVKNWDVEFMKIDQVMLFELVMAAKYLNIQSLLDLTCQTVADMIKEKSPEEIRELFNIENDFTPEEEDEIPRENQWAFE